jgi:hypothetical protein
MFKNPFMLMIVAECRTGLDLYCGWVADESCWTVCLMVVEAVSLRSLLPSL